MENISFLYSTYIFYDFCGLQTEPINCFSLLLANLFVFNFSAFLQMFDAFFIHNYFF